MKIPKIIHYCWFGGKDKSKLVKKCIESWKKILPDYQIIEWNESNFNFDENIYCNEAYKAKKWAFVSDYVRLKVLYEYGGIYLDTDVEVLKSLDVFLTNNSFGGFEASDRVATSLIASTKGNEFINDLIKIYNQGSFIKSNGSYDLTTNVTRITNYLLENGLKSDNTKQEIAGFTIYPIEYFCPKDYETRKLNLTKNSHAIHHFDGSWIDRKIKIKQFILRILGLRVINILVRLKRCILKQEEK